MTSLISRQLLYEIQLLALSPNLFLVSQHLRAVLDNAPNSLKAQYIIECITSTKSNIDNIYTKALRYRICTPPVLDIICEHSDAAPVRKRTDLPKHLFRGLDASNPRPLPFLRHIVSKEAIPSLDVNAHSGFALSMAVHSACIPLVRWLLANGAKPDTKGALAVVVAIRQKDLGLVRMLVEPEFRYPGEDQSGDPGARVERGRNAHKRRKVPDRLVCKEFPELLKTAMKREARDVVEYLRERGSAPDWAMIKAQWES